MATAMQLLPKKDSSLFKEFELIFPKVYKLILETSVSADDDDYFDDYEPRSDNGR